MTKTCHGKRRFHRSWQQNAADGKYKINLYDPPARKWKEIEIDDYLPCSVQNGFEEGFLETADPFFVKVKPGDGIYGALLEKAFAKLYGSWGKLKFFAPTAAFIAFTGLGERNLHHEVKRSLWEEVTLFQCALRQDCRVYLHR